MPAARAPLVTMEGEPSVEIWISRRAADAIPARRLESEREVSRRVRCTGFDRRFVG